jgi:hypothetical protein
VGSGEESSNEAGGDEDEAQQVRVRVMVRVRRARASVTARTAWLFMKEVSSAVSSIIVGQNNPKRRK